MPLSLDRNPFKIKEWTSISGKGTISVSNVNTEIIPSNETTYRISIELKHVVFENEDDGQTVIEKLNIKNAFIG